ncbi:Cytochrome c family protein [Tenacibaculum litoreum]|uniref:c-type heme family protein n=1 Tax=Tenacibaculum litoreum TaxID=321269 RepID=UPI003896407F
MKKLIALLAVLSIFSCNQAKKNDSSKKNIKITSAEKVTIPPGKKLLETKCFVCHNSSTPNDERVAPPMIAIKAHYIGENTSEEEFTNNFLNFVLNPTKENAVMRGAVKRYGIMPYQKFEEQDLKKIANYLYNYKIEEPSWFKEHWESKQGKNYINTGKKVSDIQSNKTSEEIGLEYAMKTKKTLGKNLMGAIQKKGTLHALQFCNEKAYKLTDSMATKFNASIKRVSDKPRNPNNTANTEELNIIEGYKRIVSNKEEIKPVTKQADNKTKFYYPIITNSMCLQCHGTPNSQIKPETLKELTLLYPTDKAQGYDVNQVRGIWSITFKN